MANDLYERFTFRGKILDRMTIAALLAAEKQYGRAFRLIQGSYNAGGVGASAGTHDGGGAVDLGWCIRFRKQNRCMRAYAKAAGWPRPTILGLWSRHYHAIIIGNEKASSGAKSQVAEYRAGGDGLVGGTPDRFWRPNDIEAFSYKKAALVSWQRFNAVSESKDKKADTTEGVKQVETVARALRGFGMTFKHRKGHVDKGLLDAIERFRKIRHVGETEVKGPLTPQVCWELCVPTVEG